MVLNILVQTACSGKIWFSQNLGKCGKSTKIGRCFKTAISPEQLVQIENCFDFRKDQKQFFHPSWNRFSIFWSLHLANGLQSFVKKGGEKCHFWWFSNFMENCFITFFWKHFKIMQLNCWHDSVKTASPKKFWFQS